MSFALTELLARNDSPSDLLFHTMNPDVVFAAGHSLGGYAAIVMVGGDDNVCNPVPVNPPPPGICLAIPRDPRFAALMALDASAQLLNFEEMGAITVPALSM